MTTWLVACIDICVAQFTRDVGMVESLKWIDHVEHIIHMLPFVPTE